MRWLLQSNSVMALFLSLHYCIPLSCIAIKITLSLLQSLEQYLLKLLLYDTLDLTGNMGKLKWLIPLYLVSLKFLISISTTFLMF
jgi:hypothetical protein